MFLLFMTILAVSGLWMSIAREILFTAFLSTIALYSFTTGWAAASHIPLAKLITKISPVISFALLVGATFGGLKAAGTVTGTLNDLPSTAFYTLSGFAGIFFLLDVSYQRAKPPSQRRRLTRHVSRMGFSAFLSTSIFFFGNNNVLPEYLRTPFYLSIPVLFVVATTMVNGLLVNFYTKRFLKPGSDSQTNVGHLGRSQS